MSQWVNESMSHESWVMSHESWVMSHESMSHESWVMSQWVRSEKIKVSVETIKLSITFTSFVYLLHCCLHIKGLFLTWNLNLGCLLAVFQALPLLLRACPKNSLPRHPSRTMAGHALVLLSKESKMCFKLEN